jgi:hypothetical protein
MKPNERIEMDAQAPTIEFPVELDYRENNGVHVWLTWLPSANRVTVRVVDMKTGASFDLPADQDPLDVFHHPFAYAQLPAVPGSELEAVAV